MTIYRTSPQSYVLHLQAVPDGIWLTQLLRLFARAISTVVSTVVRRLNLALALTLPNLTLP